MNLPLQLYSVFHLNLAYSSIEVERYPEVIKQCYWPLLRLAESYNLPIGVEATVYTLEQIERLDKRWIEKLRELIQAGICELIGSGDSQLIGPLVPFKVNQANLNLAMDSYQSMLGVRPKLVLVNEQAYAAGLVNIYQQAGFSALLMEWDNPASNHPQWSREWRYLPQQAQGLDGAQLPLIWNHSIAFQKFQRYAHGDLILQDYLAYLDQHCASTARAMPLYGNDVEVFDFRPGRFHTETVVGQVSEWERIEQLFARLISDARFQLCLPGDILALLDQPHAGHSLRLADCAQPIPVKKQRKYNVTRWAVTGRDDLWLNTLCQRLYRHIDNDPTRAADQAIWRRLCRLWASDLRTHIATGRWELAMAEASDFAGSLGVAMPQNTPLSSLPEHNPPEGSVIHDPARQRLLVRTEQVHAIFNLRRGMTIQLLSFKQHDFVPTVGTLEHGYFESIELGADFYTGGVVIELPSEHRRITDLEAVAAQISCSDDEIIVTTSLRTSFGDLEKRWRIGRHSDRICYELAFPRWQRPQGTVRIGHVTLLPEAFAAPLSYCCTSGGEGPECFVLDRDFWHTQPASTLVSASMGLGATDGMLRIGTVVRGLELSWDPTQCAAFPMIQHQTSRPGALTRIVFSLAELDETARAGGRLLPFSLTLKPI